MSDLRRRQIAAPDFDEQPDHPIRVDPAQVTRVEERPPFLRDRDQLRRLLRHKIVGLRAFASHRAVRVLDRR